MNIVLWIVEAELSLSCVFSGLKKAFLPLAKVQQHFPWANHAPSALVRFIGASDLFGGIGLVLPLALGIFPWLTLAADAGLAMLMLFAALFHVVLSHTGILKAIQEQVRFAPTRFGRHDPINFVMVLIGYALSGTATLQA